MFFDLDIDRMIDLSRVKTIMRFKDHKGEWTIGFEMDDDFEYVSFKDETACALFWDSIPRITDLEQKQ